MELFPGKFENSKIYGHQGFFYNLEDENRRFSKRRSNNCLGKFIEIDGEIILLHNHKHPLIQISRIKKAIISGQDNKCVIPANLR